MNSSDSIDDSQPEETTDLTLSWDVVSKKKDISTRKTKQLDKLYKSLKPLNNEYNDIPRTKSRHSSFQKNNQFTVIAAEFLNLSSKKELNQLHEDGYTKEEIENMLENKYQQKKEFYTDLNIKNHKFKRKNFESWRSMSNSHSVTTNTFSSEEELLAQMTKSQQLRLKRLNNKLLTTYKSQLKHNKVSESLSEKIGNSKPLIKSTPSSNPKYANIPQENGLLGISSDQNSSLIILSDINDHQKNELDNDINPHNNESKDTINNPSSPISEKINSEKIDIPNFGDDSTDKGSETDINPISNNQQNDENVKIDAGGSAIDNDKFTSIFDNIPDYNKSEDFPPLPESDIIQVPSSPQNVMIPALEIPIERGRRNLRHRTILNRNPYLVDRAEYLGLSTKYELISMEEDGKPDEILIKYLDEKYQKKRNERKEKDVGYGPYSKLSFYEIMNDVAKDNANKVSITDTPNNLDFSDQEFEFSMDENDGDVDIDDNDEAEIDSQEKLNMLNDISETYDNTKNKAKNITTSKHKINNGYAKEDDKYMIDPMIQKKTRSLGSSSKKYPSGLNKNTSSSARQPKLKTIALPAGLNRTKSDISSHISKQLNSTKTTETNDNQEFNPYSLEFLTLSDDESQNAIPKTYFNKDNQGVLNDGTKEDNKVLKSGSDKVFHNMKNMENLTSHLKLTVKQQSELDLQIKKRSSPFNGEEHNQLLKKKKVDKRNVIAESFAPTSNPNFLFNRQPLIDSFVQETTAPLILGNSKIEKINKFNIDFAKNTLNNLQNTSIKDSDKEVIFQNKNLHSKIELLWEKYSDTKSKNDHRYKFVINLKTDDYTTLNIPQSFLASNLFKKTIDVSEYYYREKNIKLEFLKTSIEFEVPLSNDSAFSKIRAFLDILLGALKVDNFKKGHLKQLRKSLIHLVMVISNVKTDCPDLLPQIGLEINSFFNKFKKLPHIDEIVFCIFAPYFLLYMKMLQKYIPPSCEFLSSFMNTESWLCRKIILHVCSVPFEKIFINRKIIVLESLSLFLTCINNPWTHLEEALCYQDIDILNVTNFLYFCNSKYHVEMDWEYFTTLLVKFCDNKNANQTFVLSSVKNIFASTLKINKDLGWEIESQLLVKMFRLLAEFKFDNIGCSVAPKASTYPNAPVTSALTQEDGCLDIYFKLLDIFTKQYLSENTKQWVERLIPVRSTFGYNPVQLQNRAKVLLMMVYMFDQDLMSGLEAMLNDMIRNGSVYSVRSSLALIKTIIKQTPRRPYNLVRKYIPLLISEVNRLPKEKEVLLILKDLIMNVNEILNGHEISHLKRMVDFFAIILKIKDLNTNLNIIDAIDNSFSIIIQQYEFAEIIEISSKDKLRLKKSCTEIVKSSKSRLLEETSSGWDIKRQYLKYFLFFNAKLEKPAPQLLYTEWNYLGSVELRKNLELNFYEYLIEWYDITSVKEDALLVYFKNLPIYFLDLSKILNEMMKKNVLIINISQNQYLLRNSFESNRINITIKSLSALVKQNEGKIAFNVLREFVKSLKAQLINHKAKEYIKEVGFFLYSIWNDKFDIPEWDYLVTELKLESVGESISRKLQFVETVDDIAVILQKNYINSIATKAYPKFIEQFNTFISKSKAFDDDILGLCFIISFHIKSIMDSNLVHWFHLLKWVEHLEIYLSQQKVRLNIFNILKMLFHFGELSKSFAASYNYRYYYYKVLYKVYKLLDWCATMFLGFDDMIIFMKTFWSFAGMDPLIKYENLDSSNTLLSSDLDKKLTTLYNSSINLLENKFTIENSEKEVYIIEEEVNAFRKALMSRWRLNFPA
jgi:hypothetical protein